MPRQPTNKARKAWDAWLTAAIKAFTSDKLARRARKVSDKAWRAYNQARTGIKKTDAMKTAKSAEAMYLKATDVAEADKDKAVVAWDILDDAQG